MGLVGQFRSSVWDPTMICAQIITMQSIFYVTLGFWLVLVDYIAGADRSLDQIFSYEVSIMFSIGHHTSKVECARLLILCLPDVIKADVFAIKNYKS